MGYKVYCKNGNVKLIKWVLVIQNAYIYIYILKKLMRMH